MIDIRQTPEYCRYLSSTGWIIATDPKNNYHAFIKKLPFIPFSILKIQRPNAMPYSKWLDNQIHKYKVIISYIEPISIGHPNFLSKMGYRLHPHPFLPSKTIELNLKNSNQVLIRKMRTTTRDNIVSAQRRKITHKIFDSYKLLEEPNLFSAILNMNRSSNHTYFSLINAFQSNSYTVVIYFDLQPAAFTTYLTSTDKVEQFTSGSTKEGRKQKCPTLSTWYGINEAIKRGYRVFDFGGIYDPRFPIKSWKGFTQFKNGFGGQPITYPGLYYKWHWPY